MKSCEHLKPGDRALLVDYIGFNQRLRVVKAIVKKVYKNGLIVVEGSSEKYRPDGSQTGHHSRYHVPPRLSPWDEELIAEAKRQKAEDDAVCCLRRLADAFNAQARDPESALATWEGLPDAVRALATPPQD